MRTLIMIAILLSGCASDVVQVKDGGTQTAYENDKALCFKEAAAAERNGPRFHIGGGGGPDMMLEQRMLVARRACMEARGYRTQSKRDGG